MQDTYRSVVQKWGNSLVIRLTNDCVRSLNINERDIIRYAVETTGESRSKRHKIPESWKKNTTKPVIESPEAQPETPEAPPEPKAPPQSSPFKMDTNIKRSILHLLKFKPVEEVLQRAVNDTEYTRQEILSDPEIAATIKQKEAFTAPQGST